MAINTEDPTILLQGDVSLFTLQRDDPADIPLYSSLWRVDGITEPLGDLTPIRLPSPTQYGKFVTVATTRAAPDLGELTLGEQARNNLKSLSEKMKTLCNYAFILKYGNCGRPDQLTDWKSLLIADYIQATEIDYGTQMQFEASERVEFTTTTNFLAIERVLPLTLAAEGESVVVGTVLDVIYADALSCGSCAPYSSGCTAKYALTVINPSSVGLSGQIVFTLDGTTYNTEDINSLAGGNGTALIAIGPYLVVSQQTTARHHWALKSDVDLSPNTYNWTAVNTGYDTGGGRCMVTDGNQRLFIGAASGNAYATDDVTAGVTTILDDASIATGNFNAIAYAPGCLLMVGDTGKILLSVNPDDDIQNIAFSVITAPSALSAVHITACAIRTPSNFEIGAANGTMYYTKNGGVSWTQRGLPSQSSWTYIQDITYSPDFPLVGAMAVSAATAGAILRTFDGGHTWWNSAPAIKQLTTAPEKYNAVALCGTNAIFAGGKKASSTDGILAEASAD